MPDIQSDSERARLTNGDSAIAGLTALISSAVRSSNDDLVTELDRILRDVEALVEDRPASAPRWGIVPRSASPLKGA